MSVAIGGGQSSFEAASSGQIMKTLYKATWHLTFARIKQQYVLDKRTQVALWIPSKARVILTNDKAFEVLSAAMSGIIVTAK